MMRKARLAIRKVNVALDSPGYCFGTGRRLPPAGTRASARLWFWTGAFVRSRIERIVEPSFVIKGRWAERFWTVIVLKMPRPEARRKPKFLWRPCELPSAGEENESL